LQLGIIGVLETAVHFVGREEFAAVAKGQNGFLHRKREINKWVL
jgi:hypothetical protein